MNFSRFIKYLSLSCSIVLFAFEVYRTAKVGYPPLFSPFDSLLLLTAIFSLISGFMDSGLIGVIVVGIFLISLLFIPSAVKEIPPIVRTPLFFVHVVCAMVAYAVILSIAVLSFIDLRRRRLTFEKPLSIAFLFFSVSMVAGGIWAYVAWADLFPFEPKSLFSLFLWFYLAFLLHLGNGKVFENYQRLFIIFAGLLVIFSFFGINFFFGGTHGF